MKKKLINLESDLSTNNQGLVSCSDRKKTDLEALGEDYWSDVGGGWRLIGIDFFCGTTNNGCDTNGSCETGG